MPGTVPGSPVLEFYNSAKIFVTGGTGFLGKALIEKFLRTCPSVDHIYILIREKKGKDPQTRMKAIFDDPLFTTLRAEKPDFEKKVTCIPGDISSERLGISDSDYEFLTKEVTHVFHSAATVRFNESIKNALGINVRGTNEILELCIKCIRLKVFVHVSTAYANCIRSDLSEDFYDPPLIWHKALSLLDTLEEDKLNSIAQELIKPWPNTYSFTKAIAESIIKEKGTSLPAVVFRPGIVMGSAKEPIRGWTDNIYGLTGLIAAVGVGLLRVLYVDQSNVANIIPVDLTVNAIITSAWEAGSSFQNNIALENSVDSAKESAEIGKKAITPKVYHFVVDSDNEITWGDFLKVNLKYGIKVPSEKAIWYYTITLTKFKMMYFFLTFLLHYVPAVLMDTALILQGKKPQILKAYKKIHTFSAVMVIFAINHWKFHNPNMKKLWSRLSDADKELFDFDMKNLNWENYLAGIIFGVRSYIFNETENTLPGARRKMFFFWLGHRLIQFSLIAICFWILSKFFFTLGDLKTQFKDPILMAPELLKNST